jgi:hypothetical protein
VIVAYVALHYGLDYLHAAIMSVLDEVDQVWCLYSPVGSHGTRSNEVCPDHAADLYEVAHDAAGAKFHWYLSTDWRTEGEQRDSIYTLAPYADFVITLDADEIWQAGAVTAAVNHLKESGHGGVLLPMVHYWRSFSRCMTDDPAYPCRIINVHSDNPIHDTLRGHGVIHHFGYAQRSEIVRYKQSTHGHIGEWRRDIDWYGERFAANAQADCHPTMKDWWTPQAVNPYDLGLPTWMQAHEYADLDVIP